VTCHCFIKHAITRDEREAASKMLERSRKLSDMQGIIIAISALSGNCPSRNKEEKKR
jgi:hypothetical protein